MLNQEQNETDRKNQAPSTIQCIDMIEHIDWKQIQRQNCHTSRYKIKKTASSNLTDVLQLKSLYLQQFIENYI